MIRMSSVVCPDQFYTGRGLRFHRTMDCKGMEIGRGLWDFDDWLQRPMREVSVLAALGEGKTPCHVCMPGSDAALAISSCEEDFGHLPVDEYTREGLTHIMCARCMRWTGWGRLGDVRVHAGVRVSWPCTSAIILGLVPRTDEQAAKLRKFVYGCETPETHNWHCSCVATPIPGTVTLTE